jgi:hypothetical protein
MGSGYFSAWRGAHREPRARKSNLTPLIFLACVIAAGARSIALGKDGNWDLRNYHWYNAWALLNGRLGWDLAPAQIQTYYNPVGDLPFYFLVQWLPWPRHVAFWMALPAAITAFFLIRILVLLFPPGAARGNLAWIAAACAIGVTGAAGTATLGSTMNEWLSAAFLMAGLWLAVRGLVERPLEHPRALVAGALLTGCAVGLKLTYAVFGLAYLVALLSLGDWREGVKRLATSSAFMLAGFLIFGGYWAWVMAREFGNPAFPYYNDLFRSPWWEPVPFFDRNWGPRDLGQWLFFPLYFARRSTLVSEIGFRDYRLAALLVLAIAAAIKFALQRPRVDPPWRFLIAFTLAAYVAWIKLFGIYRYLVPLEVLSGPLIVGCLLYLLRGMALRYACIVLLATLLAGTTRPGDWGRVPFGHGYFEVKAPQLPPDSLVIVGYIHPYAYEIPFFRSDARFVSPVNNFLALGQKNLMARAVEDAIRTHRGPVYLMQMRSGNSQDTATIQYFNLAFSGERCLGVQSPMSDNYVQVCPLKASGPA